MRRTHRPDGAFTPARKTARTSRRRSAVDGRPRTGSRCIWCEWAPSRKGLHASRIRCSGVLRLRLWYVATALTEAFDRVSCWSDPSMAKQVITLLTDDLDGREADRTVEFGLDGINYTIDCPTRTSASCARRWSRTSLPAAGWAGVRWTVAGRGGAAHPWRLAVRVGNRIRQFAGGP